MVLKFWQFRFNNWFCRLIRRLFENRFFFLLFFYDFGIDWKRGLWFLFLQFVFLLLLDLLLLTFRRANLCFSFFSLFDFASFLYVFDMDHPGSHSLGIIWSLDLRHRSVIWCWSLWLHRFSLFYLLCFWRYRVNLRQRPLWCRLVDD